MDKETQTILRDRVKSYVAAQRKVDELTDKIVSVKRERAGFLEAIRELPVLSENTIVRIGKKNWAIRCPHMNSKVSIEEAVII